MSTEADGTKNLNQKLGLEIPVVHVSDESGQYDIDLPIGSVNIESGKEDRAARKIQASWRDFQECKVKGSVSPLKSSKEYTDEQYLSALIIQNHYRNHLVSKKQKVKEENAARLIQQHYRHRLQKSEEEFEADLERAAKLAQESYNKLKEAEERDELEVNLAKSAATDTRSSEDKNDAAIFIQRQYRHHVNAKERKAMVEKEYNAAVSIQRQFRAYNTKKKNEAALKIQTQFRAHIKKNKENNAAQKIQAHYRAHLKCKHTEESSVASQNITPTNLNAVSQKIDEPLPHSYDKDYVPAVLTIQKNYRSHYQKRQAAAKTIQNQFRSYQKQKPQKFSENLGIKECNQESNEEQENAAIFIQKHYRAHVERSQMQKSQAVPLLNLNLNGTLENSPKSEIESYAVDLHSKMEIGRTCDEFIPFHTVLDNEIEDATSTNDGGSVDDDLVYWNNSETRVFSQPDVKKSKKSPTHSNVSRIPKLKDSSRQWPESKKIQYSKVKDAPRKKQVQVSLEMKREQRRSDKNKKKDRFHLSNMRKQASTVRQAESTQGKSEIGTRRAKKADTPQPKQVKSPLQT